MIVAIDHISQVMGRIAEIRSRLGLPEPGGRFAEILDAKLGSSPAGPTSTSFVPLSFPLVPLGPAPRGVMTAAELSDYLAIRGIRERNGRLGGEGLLVEVSGGWIGQPLLLPPAAEAWEQMRAAAAADGIDLRVTDAYRSWESQDRAYQAYLSGEKRANVLPPGRSEHGVGLAVDVTNGQIIGRSSPEWQWLDRNAWRFGWYPISNESWHWEFRGLGA